MFGTFEKRRAFEQYWHRLSGRPGFVRTKELDDALVAELKKAAG
jgi:glutathione S-transferase